MFFYAERFMAALFTPLPIISIALLCGLIFSLGLKKNKIGFALIITATAALILFGLTPFSRLLIDYKEKEYRPFDAVYARLRSEAKNSGAAIRYVVVLAGGASDDSELPPSSDLSRETLKRLVEGIRVYRDFPGSKLILSGGCPKDGEIKEARLMRAVALYLGVPKKDVIIDDKSPSTAEQAKTLEPILKGSDFILVTSATHLRRAAETFKKRGLNPFELPADYLAKRGPNETEFFLPSSRGFYLAEKFFYELWATIGGTVKGEL